MAETVIIWNTRDPLFGHTPAEFESELKNRLAGRVKAAYLFGSYGTPEFGRDSDIDLMLVVDTDSTFVERALAFPEVLDLVPDIDLLVYTPDEFERLSSDPSPGFWASAVASMRRIV